MFLAVLYKMGCTVGRLSTVAHCKCNLKPATMSKPEAGVVEKQRTRRKTFSREEQGRFQGKEQGRFQGKSNGGREPKLIIAWCISMIQFPVGERSVLKIIICTFLRCATHSVHNLRLTFSGIVAHRCIISFFFYLTCLS